MLIDSFDQKTYAPTRFFEKEPADEEKNFKSILYKKTNKNNKEPETFVSNSDGITNRSSKKIHLGTISDDVPTVSELLYTTSYKDKCWEMLEKDVNSSKYFRKIQAGTDIYLDTSTSEIVWKKEEEGSFLGKDKADKQEIYNSFNDNSFIHKLKKSRFVNKDNSGLFTRISRNEVPLKTIYIQPKNLPITSSSIPSTDNPSVAATHNRRQLQKQAAPALHEAVREFMGEDYSKIDCYELVVNGLENIGIKYQGKDGIGKYLVDKALAEGFNRNHYLNGEGLVEAAGQSVYNKTILRVKNPELQAENAMAEMEKVLKEGQILAFSTHTRGHTGVISKKNGVWTFINSGYMDNNIAGTNGKKQVGEEILSKELENWFKLAGNKKEGLKITVGDIELSKIAAYLFDNSRISKKV